MKFLKDWYEAHNDLHHAHLFFGDRTALVKEIELFLSEQLSFSVHGNPDYWKENFSVFGIDDSRRITAIARRRAFSKARTIVVLCVDSLTIEAQNSLLKLFEDPVSQVHFFVITQKDIFLLPTLLSRMLLVRTDNRAVEHSDIEQGRSFISASIASRIKFLTPLFEEKDKNTVRSFLDGLEAALKEQFYKNKEMYAPVLRSVIQTRGYVPDRSSSLKMILEHIAHVIPVTGD